MTDLLTPEQVREWLNGPLGQVTYDVSIARLCRDYLTLWDRNKGLAQQAEVQRQQLRWFDHQLQESEQDD